MYVYSESPPEGRHKTTAGDSIIFDFLSLLKCLLH